MLTTTTVTFCGGERAMAFGVRSRSLLRPDRPQELCSICGERSWPWHPARREAKHRGQKYLICGPCQKRYHDARGQIERYGFRFRLVERAEIRIVSVDSPPPLPIVKQIYKILLLTKERQEIRQKEVNWMVDEMTTHYLRSPVDIARIISDTFVCAGDDAKKSDDQALLEIKDLLEERFPEIFETVAKRRRQKKRLT